MSATSGNLLVLQGGGPTAVVNASLYGVIDEANRSARFNQILGARFGIEGLLKDDLLDLSALSSDEIEKLRTAPGASLGSTRVKPADADLDRILQHLKRRDIRALLIIGGNGSLRGAHAISQAAAAGGYDLSIIGIPKTIDNDIPGTDRCPGYGSAARYVAQSVRDLGMDIRTLPQPVTIFETMGRSAGWLAAASVLAKLDDDHAPHLVYLPEIPFDPDRFLSDLDNTVRKLGWAVAVVSEGITTATGQLVYESSEPSQQDALNRALPGGVATYLADLVTRRLKIRCRSEKPGLIGRASTLHVSAQDRADAELVGRAAVRAALTGSRDSMIALSSLVGSASADRLLPLPSTLTIRPLPPEFLDAASPLAVSPRFHEYVRPIVGNLIDYPVPLAKR